MYWRSAELKARIHISQPVTPSLDALIKSGQKYLAIDALTEVNRWHSAMPGGSKREQRDGLNPPVYNGDSKLFNIHWQYLNAVREVSALVSMLAGLKTAICFAVSELLAEKPDQLSIDAKVVNNCLAALSVARKCMNRIVEINLFQNKLDLNIVGHANLQNIGKELETGGLPDVSSKWYPLWNLSQDKLRQELEQARIQGIVSIRT